MSDNPEIIKVLRRVYVLQALSAIVWWLLLFLSEDFYGYFAFEGVSWEQFLFFAPGDIIFLVIFPILFCFNSRPLFQKISVGGIFISTAASLFLSLNSDSGWLGTGIMTVCLLLNIAFMLNGKMFIRRKESRNGINILKTFMQTVFVWWISLYFLPVCILDAFPSDKSPLNFQIWHSAIYILALLLMIGNFWSGYTMAKVGKGTPLPLDSASVLVISGPYAYVRNPMSVTGLGLGYCEAALFQSPALFIYVTSGLLIWNYMIRPFEEIDLKAVFGEQFEEYCRNVKCWIPRLLPYCENEGSNDVIH